MRLRDGVKEIIDSHCHAWRRWPYQPAVPDDESRGSIEQLLFEMDQNVVDQAVVICANIFRNPENNDYVFEESIKYPDRIHFFPDIDSGGEGRPETYHTPGASDRLRRALGKWPIKGFNHYLLPDDDSAWLYSAEGLEFFGVAADAGLIASIACGPHHQPAIRRLAESFLSMPILCPHIAGVTATSRTRFFTLMVDELTRFFNGDETLFNLSPNSLANRRGQDTVAAGSD